MQSSTSEGQTRLLTLRKLADVSDPNGMDDGENTCAAEQSPIRKVKLTHVTDEDTLRGIMKEAERCWKESMDHVCNLAKG